MIRHTVTIQGKQVSYWERNPHLPVTIVALHGFRGNHKGLTEMSQHLQGYRVIVPDLPGYGESEALDVPHTLTNYAGWLDQFVGALELEEWVSWSHSYSGSIALIQATEGKHPPVAAVSVSLADVRRDLASAASTIYYWLGQYLPRRWITSRTIDHAAGRWLFMTVTPRRRKVLQKRGERNLPILNAKVVIEEYLSSMSTPLEPYARRLEIPMLIIAGAKDAIVPRRRLERLVTLMPKGSILVMPDQGHLAPIERPAATATLTKRYLSEQAALARHPRY
ncbi:MAG TPA: alpha/beta hydrolase [Candidatus Saccharimonadia bacterium]|jgi:pimeloyl-ACP methyl ester carboxylesterase